MPEQNMESANTEGQPVELKPFIHQVGGHTSMFRLNENTVCKPLCLREYRFYSALPQELLPFTPECRGVVQVKVHVYGQGKGSFRLLAHRLDLSGEKPGFDNIHRSLRPAQTDRIENEENQSSEDHEDHEDHNDQEDQRPKNYSANQNPWIEDVFNRQMRRLSMEDSNKFISLENIVARYTKPCVLDLKMGQRQHGDDASPEKRQLMQDRCENSTSNQLGVRASGMQVYHVETEQYIYFSKYDGRALNAEGFKSSLAQFLHNGQRLRYELIAPILFKLCELKKVVETLDTFRFYSSSLLIMYDGIDACWGSSSGHQNMGGGAEAPCVGPRVDVRMVDFAHSTFKGFMREDEEHMGLDTGYLHGLSTLIELFQELQQLSQRQT
ncbi:inositol hexakisphosphate kinase 1-like [Liolophura sinensis]|uniref:inositol hexakisphosphate kinase 1-like n=1 Tax=Liolophura sinensis TaxID=3198878 RepID=UPI003158F512